MKKNCWTPCFILLLRSFGVLETEVKSRIMLLTFKIKITSFWVPVREKNSSWRLPSVSRSSVITTGRSQMSPSCTERSAWRCSQKPSLRSGSSGSSDWDMWVPVYQPLALGPTWSRFSVWAAAAVQNQAEGKRQQHQRLCVSVGSTSGLFSVIQQIGGENHFRMWFLISYWEKSNAAFSE